MVLSDVEMVCCVLLYFVVVDEVYNMFVNVSLGVFDDVIVSVVSCGF